MAIEETDMEFSGYSTYRHSEKIKGVILCIATPKGTENVKYPRTISITDEQALLNQMVKYTSSKNSEELSRAPGDGIVHYKYSLEILTGALKGKYSVSQQKQVFL